MGKHGLTMRAVILMDPHGLTQELESFFDCSFILGVGLIHVWGLCKSAVCTLSWTFPDVSS